MYNSTSIKSVKSLNVILAFTKFIIRNSTTDNSNLLYLEFSCLE